MAQRIGPVAARIISTNHELSLALVQARRWTLQTMTQASKQDRDAATVQKSVENSLIKENYLYQENLDQQENRNS